MSAAARSAMKASTVVFFVAAGKISASSGVSVSGESLPCSMMMRMAARSYTQPSLAMTGSVRSMSVIGQQSSAGSMSSSSRVRCFSLLSTRPATWPSAVPKRALKRSRRVSTRKAGLAFVAAGGAAFLSKPKGHLPPAAAPAPSVTSTGAAARACCTAANSSFITGAIASAAMPFAAIVRTAVAIASGSAPTAAAAGLGVAASVASTAVSSSFIVAAMASTAMPVPAIVRTAFASASGSAVAAAAPGLAAAAAAASSPLAAAAAALNGQRLTSSLSGGGSAHPDLSSSSAFGPSPAHSRRAAVVCTCE